MRKMSLNAWVGTLGIEHDTAFCLRSSGCKADLEPLGNGECPKIGTTYGDRGQTIFDYVFSTRLERGGASFRPIHDMTLHNEATSSQRRWRSSRSSRCLPAGSRS